MICVPFPLIWWHCTRQLLTPRAPALPSASVREATCSLTWVIQQYSGSIPVSSQQLICVWKGGELQKWEVPRKATQLFCPCVWSPARSTSHNGSAVHTPTICHLSAEAKRTFSVLFLGIFQINFFKKGAEMFSKRMDSFLSSVSDMVQR